MTAVLSLAAILFLFLLIHGRNDRVARKAQSHRPVRHAAPKPLSTPPPVVKGQPHGFFDEAAERTQRADLVPVTLWRTSRKPFASHVDDALAIGAPAEVDELSKRRKA